ncbi:MAG: DUF6067 family protein [Proteobacteria bacterium]|nr:DUF6067 family protein [Pseudomonadota bacterium]
MAAPSAAEAKLPSWWGNALGRDEIVLPGFDRVGVEGTTVTLGSRRYRWSESYLPVAVESRAAAVAEPMALRIKTDGRWRDLRPESVHVVEATPHHAVLEARGRIGPDMTLRSRTRVEYDGVAMVEVTLQAERETLVQALETRVRVPRRPSLGVLRFDARSIRRKRRAVWDGQTYAGDFVNVLGFADGLRSFWWFADDARGWLLPEGPVTLLRQDSSFVELRQRLISGQSRVRGTHTFRFNFLATPIRELGSGWRRERIVRRANPKEAQLGRFQLWWITAFAHQDLPYTTYPPGAREALPERDREAYPGPDTNRANVRKWRRMGIERLPYFSGHCLSELDPALALFGDRWRIVPKMGKRGDAPFAAPIPKPWLSHRAEGYTDYLLHRFNREIDRLDLNGLYFDQGRVIDSQNPDHGGWRDSQGRRQGSLDILANRSYLKRLRTLFHVKGRPGHLFTHTSGVEVIPAYTFATSIVNGEQFRGAYAVDNDDYMGSLPLDDARIMFAPQQYGLRITWLPQIWHEHSKDPNWPGSTAQRRAWRNFRGLALVHDTPVWPFGREPEDERLGLIQALDRYGVSEATFTGYWEADAAVRTGDEDALVSFYRRPGQPGALLVVANLSPHARTIDLALDVQELGLAPNGWRWETLVQKPRQAGDETGVRLQVSIPGRDFTLVRLDAAS